VRPAAHFHMRGLATDADGRTSVPGLFAAGEVACNGVHGANRLDSNSLLEGVLCGRRLGKLLAHANTQSSAMKRSRWSNVAKAWHLHSLRPCANGWDMRPVRCVKRRPCAMRGRLARQSTEPAGRCASTRWARIGGRIAAADAEPRGLRRDDFFNACAYGKNLDDRRQCENRPDHTHSTITHW
jgi:hypothetical protein